MKKWLFTLAALVSLAVLFPVSALAMNVWPFFEGMAVIVTDDEKYGFMDTSGKIVVEPIYEDANNFSDGLAYVCKDEKFGFIDKTGQLVIPLIYDNACNFSEGLAQVCIDGNWGYINKSGDVVIPIQYGFSSHFSEGIVATRTSNDLSNKEIHYYNADNQRLFSDRYFAGEIYEFHFSEGLAAVADKDGKFGYIDKRGKTVIPFIYSRAEPFENGFARVELSGKAGIIDKTGKEVVPCKYHYIIDSDEEYFLVAGYQSMYYCFDSKGNLLFETKTRLLWMGDGIINAWDDKGNEIFLDTTGKLALSTPLDICSVFREGVALVRNEAYQEGVIDKTGAILIPCEYDCISVFNEGYASAIKDGKFCAIKNPLGPPDPFKNRFTDVTATDWFYPSVKYVTEESLMTGTSDKTFAPNQELSRAMLVTVLWRGEGMPEAAAPGAFTDVTSGAWYEKAVSWAAEKEIVLGYEGDTFRPDASITREQLMTILYRYIQHKGGGFEGAWMFLLDYADRESISSWAYEPVAYGSTNGIVSGKPGNLFDPQGTATRAEAATVLYHFFGEKAEE